MNVITQVAWLLCSISRATVRELQIKHDARQSINNLVTWQKGFQQNHFPLQK